MVKRQLRSLVQTFAPELLRWRQARHLRVQVHKRFGALEKEAHRILFSDGAPKILSGPFKGMPYLNETVWASIVPKWIGSYEAELHRVVEEVIAEEYRDFVNIGCAEGYYAVGLAWRVPGSRVVAFDLDPIARRQTGRLASLAGVADRIEIRTNCTPAVLDQVIHQRTLLFVDVEGFEVQLLNPQIVPNLVRASFLVEVHSCPPQDVASVAETLRQRFEGTHNLRWFEAESRNPMADLYKTLWNGKTTEERFQTYLDEDRPELQRWLFAVPR